MTTTNQYLQRKNTLTRYTLSNPRKNLFVLTEWRHNRNICKWIVGSEAYYNDEALAKRVFSFLVDREAIYGEFRNIKCKKYKDKQIWKKAMREIAHNNQLIAEAKKLAKTQAGVKKLVQLGLITPLVYEMRHRG